MLWSPSGKATNLDLVLGSGWTNTAVEGINNSGDIIGEGDYHGGIYGFLLRPVSSFPLSAAAAPELSTWAMLVVGLAILGLGARERVTPRSQPQRPVSRS